MYNTKNFNHKKKKDTEYGLKNNRSFNPIINLKILNYLFNKQIKAHL